LLTQESFRAILSANQRSGRWEPAEEIRVHAIMGEVTLDFTRAELPPSGMIEIDALAFCGEIHIIVPDGAEVELNGTPFVGSIEQKARQKGIGRPGPRIGHGGARRGSAGAPSPSGGTLLLHRLPRDLRQHQGYGPLAADLE
jgi:hypothetical protein